ncbi:syntaxin-51-related [Anaeramoeba flamelloides]|uniref:Syntaxin-51-related n=1 Tax=Anaeramoeba flamelloides TaxID=1746091 RepID=A0AAV8A197_9EUKA|nr:syntaxin-51-related [Anaeramoeba flamelloides]KAJ6246435.1 syntaxin-51-related [Anaeramoeba flamelloides]
MQQSEKWLELYEELEIKIRTTASQILNKKKQEKDNQINSRQPNIIIRKSLTEIKTLISQLSKGLKEMKSDFRKYGLTFGEYNRRKNLIKDKQRDYKKLQQDFATKPIESIVTKKLKEGPLEETKETQGLDNEELLDLEKENLDKQDELIDKLDVSVQRQTQIALTINEELDEQKPLLDDIDTKMTKTNSKIVKNTKRLSRFEKLSKKKGMTCIICLLILVIVFLCFLLFTSQGTKLLDNTKKKL